jgi:hypothetical protein
MKCFTCEEEASTSVRHQAMFSGMETTMFYCKDCFKKGVWK